MLGTIVEIGVGLGVDEADDDSDASFAAAFAELRDVEACLSRFEPASDVGRFDAIAAGERLSMRPAMHDVLRLAEGLREASDAAFDISVGTAPRGWRCEGRTLRKLDARVRLDLGGIGKGYAVDRAVAVLCERGVASGWVNAGGDLRSFGGIDVPVQLRDEASGGVRPFATLRDGAFATSRLGAMHVSVAAPRCAWADALTKVVAATGDLRHPLLATYDAVAWIH